MRQVMTVDSPVGPLQLAAEGDELVGLSLPDRPGPGGVEGETAILQRAARQLAEYFAGTRRSFDLRLGLRGTAFQAHVWRTLTELPYGDTTTYGALAQAIGRPAASRAVGAANGSNPIAIIVPCHRVIGANGQLTGYGGGLPMKRWLLAHERAHAGGGPAPR
jgi:methylated-DNA-[protein]-cysteine S-methyltransferase